MAKDSPQIRALQMEDWLDDLAEFPAMFVAQACKEWRQDTEKGQWRPTPTDIRRLAIEARNTWEIRNAPPRTRIAPWKPAPEPRMTEEEREANRLACLEIAQNATRRIREGTFFRGSPIEEAKPIPVEPARRGLPQHTGEELAAMCDKK